MAKVLILAVCMVAAVLAEPPSSYLPPQARNSPSGVYGAPNGGFRSNGKASSFHSQRTGSQSFSYNSLHENQFGGSSAKKSFGSGFNGVSQQYGAPSQSYRAPGQNGGNGFGVSQQYGAPSQSYRAPAQNGGNGFGISQQYGAPSQSYRAPGQNGGNGFGVSQQYGAPSFGGNGNGFKSGNGFGVSQRYGAPSSGNGFGLSQQYGAPSQSYRAPGQNGGNGFGLSQQYGAPSFGASSQRFSSNGANGFGAPSPKYGVPSARYGVPSSKMDDDLAEPANYEYTYEVQAAEESGAEFGHQESREDEFARGVYHVLLPDGRTQIVEYEADEEGFRPVIRYEEPAGYPEARGSQGPY